MANIIDGLISLQLHIIPRDDNKVFLFTTNINYVNDYFVAYWISAHQVW